MFRDKPNSFNLRSLERMEGSMLTDRKLIVDSRPSAGYVDGYNQRSYTSNNWSYVIVGYNILFPAEEPDRRQRSAFFERPVVLCRVRYAMLSEHLRKRVSQSTTLKSKFKDDGHKDFVIYNIFHNDL